MIKICNNCGREFIPKRKLANCCSEKCTREWKVKYRRTYYEKVGKKKERERRNKKRDKKNISEELLRINNEARAAGMSYGEYVARTSYGMR